MSLKKLHTTDHSCEQYIKRFNRQLAAIKNERTRKVRAAKAIKTLARQSVYLYDSPKGVQLYHKGLRAKLIVQNGVVITLYPYYLNNNEL